MKIVYKNIEISDRYKYNKEPLRFRMKLKKYVGYFEITTEYFKYGFLDGEHDDEVFAYYTGHNIKRCKFFSIMTKNIDNMEYLKSFEKILIQSYIDYSKSIIPELSHFLQKTTIDINDEIIDARESIKYLLNYDRREKLKNIIKNEEAEIKNIYK